MFGNTISLFDDYYRCMDKENRPGFVRDLGAEVRQRLQQMDYLLARVDEAENALKATHSSNQQEGLNRLQKLEAEGLGWESEKYPVPLMSAGRD